MGDGYEPNGGCPECAPVIEGQSDLIGKYARTLEEAEAENDRLREALAEIISMIDGCLDAPRNPDSLPQMIRYAARAALTADYAADILPPDPSEVMRALPEESAATEAAPSLREALTMLLETAQDSLVHDDPDSFNAQAIAKARAALLSARGEA